MKGYRKSQVKKEVKKYLTKGYKEVYEMPSVEDAMIKNYGKKGGKYLKKLIRGKAY